MTAATASKETVTPFPKAKKAIAAAVADPAPPPDLMVPAIDPLSEFRADQQRRRMDAQGEIDLLTEQDRLADESHVAKIAAAEEALDRLKAFEAQKRDAEHERIAAEIEEYRQIVIGADAALEATEPTPSDD